MDITSVVLANAPLSVGASSASSSLAEKRFQAIMQADETLVTPVAVNASSLPASLSIVPMAERQTMGSQILNGLINNVSEISGKWQTLASRINHISREPSIADMLHVQADLLNMSVQYEVLSKAVSKTTQNVDSLVRMS